VNAVHPIGGAGGAVISVLDPQGAQLLFSTYVSDTTGSELRRGSCYGCRRKRLRHGSDQPHHTDHDRDLPERIQRRIVMMRMS